MPLDNLNSHHFTEDEQRVVKDLLRNLEQFLAVKLMNLQPEDRKRFGSVNEQNKLFINKVADFARSQPELRSPDVEWEEFLQDFESREFMEMILLRLQALVTGLNNAKIAHDYDNYQASRRDYAYTKYKAKSTEGYSVKLRELQQFFKREHTKKKPQKGNES